MGYAPAVRASRLVNLLLLLQSRGGMTAAELARELEVSVRTIHRDVEELSAAGVPIYAERGPAGGIRLVDGYRTRLTGMTADEAEALFLSGLPGPAAQLGLGTVVAAAQLKVMAALPPELRSRAPRLLQRFHLDPAGWYQVGEAVSQLTVLSTAVWEGRCAAITYRRGSEVVERTIGPLGLVLKGGVWYVVAAVDGQIRTYRASRVVTASLLDTPVVVVDVRVREDQLYRVDDVLGSGSVDASERVAEHGHPGAVRLRVRISYPEEAPNLLLAVGPNLEVIGPPEIREQVAMLATRVAERYRETTPVDALR